MNFKTLLIPFWQAYTEVVGLMSFNFAYPVKDQANSIIIGGGPATGGVLSVDDRHGQFSYTRSRTAPGCLVLPATVRSRHETCRRI